MEERDAHRSEQLVGLAELGTLNGYWMAVVLVLDKKMTDSKCKATNTRPTGVDWPRLATMKSGSWRTKVSLACVFIDVENAHYTTPKVSTVCTNYMDEPGSLIRYYTPNGNGAALVQTTATWHPPRYPEYSLVQV